MNKSIAVKLAIGCSILLTAYIFTGNFDKNSAPANTEKNLVSKTSIETKNTTPIENNTQISTAENTYATSKETKVLYESKFKKQCLDVLSEKTNSIKDNYISPEIQAKISRTLNDCVYEIEMELALTEKEFNDSVNRETCLDSVYKIRDYLLDLGTEAQAFSELPNHTDSDQVMILEAFDLISHNIITSGGSAMINRSIACSMDLK